MVFCYLTFNVRSNVEFQKNIYSLAFCINLNICSFYMLHTIFQHLSCRCAIFAHNIFLFSASSMENKSVTIEKETLTRTYFKRKEKKLPNMNEKIRSKIFLFFNKINYGYLSHCFLRIFFLQNKVKVVLKLEISTWNRLIVENPLILQKRKKSVKKTWNKFADKLCRSIGINEVIFYFFFLTHFSMHAAAYELKYLTCYIFETKKTTTTNNE